MLKLRVAIWKIEYAEKIFFFFIMFDQKDRAYPKICCCNLANQLDRRDFYSEILHIHVAKLQQKLF